MYNSSFFTAYQKEVNDSQKKLADLWEDSQKELSESQKKLFYKWVDTVRNTTPQAGYAENMEKALNFQKELINSALNTQQVALTLAIETQKQFWDDYFQLTEKAKQETV